MDYDDPEFDELLESYFKSLGHFIAVFGLTEVHVTSLLIFCLGTSNDIAKANLSGVRLEQAISQIRRTYEADKTKIDPILNDTLTQISKINKVRNYLVHYGFEIRKDDLAKGQVTISNKISAHAERTLREFKVTPEILETMATDLQLSIVRIEGHLYRHEMTDEEQFNRHYGPARAEPWQYTKHLLE